MREEYAVEAATWLTELFESGDVLGVSAVHLAATLRGWRASLSTTRRTLYFASEFGLLNRAWGWTGKRQGWVFALPDTMPTLLALTEWAGQDNPEEVL